MKPDEAKSCRDSLRAHWGWSGARMVLLSGEERAPMICTWRKKVRKTRWWLIYIMGLELEEAPTSAPGYLVS